MRLGGQHLVERRASAPAYTRRMNVMSECAPPARNITSPASSNATVSPMNRSYASLVSDIHEPLRTNSSDVQRETSSTTSSNDYATVSPPSSGAEGAIESIHQMTADFMKHSNMYTNYNPIHANENPLAPRRTDGNNNPLASPPFYQASNWKQSFGNRNGKCALVNPGNVAQGLATMTHTYVPHGGCFAYTDYPSAYSTDNYSFTHRVSPAGKQDIGFHASPHQRAQNYTEAVIDGYNGRQDSIYNNCLPIDFSTRNGIQRFRNEGDVIGKEGYKANPFSDVPNPPMTRLTHL